MTARCTCVHVPQCMAVYAAFKIREGDYVIECPDANCDCSGELTLEEMESLVGNELYQLHLKFRKNTGGWPSVVAAGDVHVSIT